MRYFLDIAYKGTDYHGWQIQPNARTVQEELQKALSTILRKPIEVTGSGRTDTGVHARQQVVHFDFPEKLSYRIHGFKLNALLPKDISVKDLFQVKDEAHARFDAIERAYRYQISLKKDPFLTDTAYQIRDSLNIEAMNEACRHLLGRQDFECFSKVHTDVNNFFCEIKEARWEESGNLVTFRICANRFLRNMVRAIVGTLLEIGREKIPPKSIIQIIDSKNRQQAGRSVPAHGLALAEVVYPDTIRDC